jgi:hypothetical protein
MWSCLHEKDVVAAKAIVAAELLIGGLHLTSEALPVFPFSLTSPNLVLDLQVDRLPSALRVLG